MPIKHDEADAEAHDAVPFAADQQAERDGKEDQPELRGAPVLDAPSPARISSSA